jgi:hypothetical protein
MPREPKTGEIILRRAAGGWVLRFFFRLDLQKPRQEQQPAAERIAHEVARNVQGAATLAEAEAAILDTLFLFVAHKCASIELVDLAGDGTALHFE